MRLISIIFLGMLGAAAFIAVMIYLNVEPFTKIPGSISALSGQVPNVVQLVTQNWQVITAGATIATTIGGVLYKWYQAAQAKKEALQAAYNAQQSQLASQVEDSQIINGYKLQLAEAEKKIASYESDGSLLEAQNLLSQKNTEVEQARMQMQAVQDQYTNFVKSMLTSDYVTGPGGEVFRVIKIETPIVK